MINVPDELSDITLSAFTSLPSRLTLTINTGLAEAIKKGNFDTSPLSQYSKTLERCVQWMLNINQSKRPSIIEVVRYVERQLNSGYARESGNEDSLGEQVINQDPKRQYREDMKVDNHAAVDDDSVYVAKQQFLCKQEIFPRNSQEVLLSMPREKHEQSLLCPTRVINLANGQQQRENVREQNDSNRELALKGPSAIPSKVDRLEEIGEKSRKVIVESDRDKDQFLLGRYSHIKLKDGKEHIRNNPNNAAIVDYELPQEKLNEIVDRKIEKQNNGMNTCVDTVEDDKARKIIAHSRPTTASPSIPVPIHLNAVSTCKQDQNHAKEGRIVNTFPPLADGKLFEQTELKQKNVNATSIESKRDIDGNKLLIIDPQRLHAALRKEQSQLRRLLQTKLIVCSGGPAAQTSTLDTKIRDSQARVAALEQALVSGVLSEAIVQALSLKAHAQQEISPGKSHELNGFNELGPTDIACAPKRGDASDEKLELRRQNDGMGRIHDLGYDKHQIPKQSTDPFRHRRQIHSLFATNNHITPVDSSVGSIRVIAAGGRDGASKSTSGSTSSSCSDCVPLRQDEKEKQHPVVPFSSEGEEKKGRSHSSRPVTAHFIKRSSSLANKNSGSNIQGKYNIISGAWEA